MLPVPMAVRSVVVRRGGRKPLVLLDRARRALASGAAPIPTPPVPVGLRVMLLFPAAAARVRPAAPVTLPVRLPVTLPVTAPVTSPVTLPVRLPAMPLEKVLVPAMVWSPTV